MPTILRISLIALLVAQSARARGQQANEGLEGRVAAVLSTPGYSHGRWGLLVVDAKSGQVVYQKNADEMMRPASVTKLFSTAAALAEFGAEYRFITPVVATSAPEKATGLLRGDLILVAQGDPVLGGRTGADGSLLFADNDHIYAGPNSKSTVVAADPLGGLDHLAREVAAAGVKRIEGDVLIDDRLFDGAESTGSGPGRVTPIAVNDNLVDVVVSPAANPGEPARVTIVPETAFVCFDARVETIAPDARKHVTVENAGPRRFLVRGRVPAGSAPSYHIYEVERPADYARALFIECLRRRGVDVPASPLGENRREALPTRDQVAALPRLSQYTSPPLREYLKVILKVSHNLHASSLPLLLASKHGGRTLADGLKRQGELLKGLGVDVSTISFGGGAGGSIADLVTPRATVALLQAMAARPDFSSYEAALPILGRDGTLAEAVAADSPARGHVRAKTGTYYIRDGLTGKFVLTSKALAGYMETASGRRLVFAYFVNDVPLVIEGDDVSDATAAAGRLLGRLCEVFYDDAPSPAAETPKPEVKPETKAEAKPAAPVEPPEPSGDDTGA
jgi:D-alanyl-D-alanine carboxypeptidase/D-alanyl-D-alanine-endopeptidase (penicillin-binding protein 4)